ncbi:phage tail protein [Bartonella sp. WD12.1]|uniref:phage tail protein n=1 Tax=Bartonella sp. WD12.1 TaxID=1933903 RepID=UPI000999F0AB|nr:phage tail protein [Bartonella sp. WD12.1]OPB29521.1 Phage tail protein (Tail P2 I) [Bartonella sp. WD12.1]OPB29843.1 Phage tail protein (Tail P2 I) [Bartonella sp. WD12.1]OPB30055.1 Phage tail protein (Tail P2 I) [Bartonella sp. WD12.1]
MLGCLLPTNTTQFEKRLADACDFHKDIEDSINFISRAKLDIIDPSFLPWLVEEYGLGELTSYVPDFSVLLETGPEWQRVRGSLAAIDKGLEWLDLNAHFVGAWPERKWWNSFQLYFDQLPDTDKLKAIEGIVKLSECLRSDLWRGIHGYDAPIVEGNISRLDDSMFDSQSGVCVTESGTVFSFGRSKEISLTLTEEDGKFIGNWIDDQEELVWEGLDYPWDRANFPWESAQISEHDVLIASQFKDRSLYNENDELIDNWIDDENEEFSWKSLDYPWDEANVPWVSDQKNGRDILMANWFKDRTLYLALRDNNNKLIGYRRCNIVQQVTRVSDGVYSYSGHRFTPFIKGTKVLLAARTQFDDINDKQAAFVSVFVHAAPAKHISPGKLWLEPDELIDGVEILKTPVSLSLRKDVREQFKILLRF